MRAERWRFEWRRTWAEVWSSAFEQTWRALLAASASAHVYHQPALVRLWAETCGRAADAEPMFGLARSQDGAELLLPWVVVRYVGRFAARRTLEPAGGDLFGYHDPLVARVRPAAVDWSAFWRSARDQVRSGCDQALLRFLPPSYIPAGDGRLRSDDSPVLDLRGCAGLDDVLARCSSSHRVDVKRQMRRLSQRGDVRLWTAGPADVAEALDEVRAGLLPAYRARWNAPARRLQRPALELFLERVVTAGVASGWAHVSALRAGNRSIAWHVGFLDRGRLYYWLPAHDDAWANYSPGKLMLASLLDAGCHAGVTEVHLLTGNHEYKAAWNPSAQPLAAIAWKAPTIRGRLMAWYDAVRRAS